jgi:hypothetical protein
MPSAAFYLVEAMGPAAGPAIQEKVRIPVFYVNIS